MTLRKFTELCNRHHNSILEHFHHPRKVPPAHLQSHPVPTPGPGQLLIYFLSVYICLFFTFPIHGVIHYIVFCVWLLLFSTVLLNLSFIIIHTFAKGKNYI